MKLPMKHWAPIAILIDAFELVTAHRAVSAVIVISWGYPRLNDDQTRKAWRHVATFGKQFTSTALLPPLSTMRRTTAAP